MLDGGIVVTNAHVVWPSDRVRVLFPDGSEYQDVPVANWDLLADLAVLGPITTDVPPIALSTLEDLDVGSEVYLVGYPGEVDMYPQPTITRGLISRIRECEPLGVTYFQTDASIGGGQSGGMLVTEYGEVIGISSFLFSDAEFGMGASSKDIIARVEGLIAGEDTAGINYRRLPTTGGARSHYPVTIDHEWDAATYLVNEPIDTEVTVTADGDQTDLGLTVYDVYGQIVSEMDERIEGPEEVSFTTVFDAPYFVVVRQFSDYTDPVTVASSSELIPLVDLDDGRGLGVGSAITGNLDHPRDLDHYRVALAEGDKINIVAQSLNVDSVLAIGRRGDRWEQLLFDDDSGGGMFGADAELSFMAPDSGLYLIIVGDLSGRNGGAYHLEVREVYEGAPTPMIPPPTPEYIASEFGPMDIFVTESSNLVFQYPVDWTPDDEGLMLAESLCSEATACFPGPGAVIVVAEEDLAGLQIASLDEYLDLSAAIMEEFGCELLAQESFTTASGLSGAVLTINFFDMFYARRLVLLQDNTAFNITYLSEPDRAESLWPLAEYTFASVAEYD